jgi:glucose-1-phosphatase
MDLSGIKNIIFDLGNVILDIEPQKTYDAFANLSKKYSAQEIEEIISKNKLWHSYEKGEISDGEFRTLIRQGLDIEASDEKIDTAFNALLLDLEQRRVDLLEHLSNKFRVFLLSNTSKIHMDEFAKIVKRTTNKESIWPIFEKPYFSYEMGKMKPDLEFYKEVLENANLIPEETLFIDDLPANIEAAKQLKINTIHIVKPISILHHFANAL